MSYNGLSVCRPQNPLNLNTEAGRLAMAKIVIQTNNGEEIKVISASDHSLRNCNHSLLSASGLITEILKAVEEALDKDVDGGCGTDHNLRTI